MVGILAREKPWIELIHSESYSLFHDWLKNVKPMGMSTPMTKYRDLDPVTRAERREAWNQPILWPLYAGLALLVVLIVPGIVTFLRERQ